MLFPDKLFTYSESVISKFPAVLDVIKKQPIKVEDLYISVNKYVSGTAEFLDVLDCLYALGKVDYDVEKEVLRYVERD
jgi:hypothetical protein